jgi:RimJ/RimL family protein N-acetyltransferase
MINLVLGLDPLVAKWVQERIPGARELTPHKAIGIADGTKLIAGVVFSNYHGYMIEVSIAATDRRWANRRTLNVLFAYPFSQLKVRRLQVTIAKRNKYVRKFVQRLGFVYEGTGRQAWPDGGDACVYSMLRHECRWLKENKNERFTLGADRA